MNSETFAGPNFTAAHHMAQLRQNAAFLLTLPALQRQCTYINILMTILIQMHKLPHWPCIQHKH